MKIVKNFMKKSDDPQAALLEYNTTPMADLDSAPAQLLNSRRLRTRVPISTSLLRPETQPNKHKQLRKKQNMQKIYHDRKAQRKFSPPVKEGETVRVHHKGKWRSAQITDELPNNSYKVQLPTGERYRRTRNHLKKTGETPPQQTPSIPVIIEDIPEPWANPAVETKSATKLTPKSPKPPSPKPVKSSDTHTRSGRLVVKPNKLDL